MLEISQMPPDADNLDMGLPQPPKLILFQIVDVFSDGLT